MKQFFVLMVVLALAAGTATVVTAHPTSGGRKLRGLLWRKFLSAIPVLLQSKPAVRTRSTSSPPIWAAWDSSTVLNARSYATMR